MTLAIAWKSADGIRMAADSRLNFNEIYVDQGIKVMSAPYRIYGPGERSAENILAEGQLGFCFAGSAVAALTLCEAMRDVLTQMQGAPGYSDHGMDGVVDLLWRAYEVLETDLCAALDEKGLAKVIIAGFCAVSEKQRAFLFDVDKKTFKRSRHEILRSIGDREAIGTGADAALALLPQDATERDYINALRQIIDDPTHPTVGGAVQYGRMTENKFKVFGVATVGDHTVHYWRAGLDLNNGTLTSGSGLVLGYPLLDLIR